jgi:hypothetical protein
LNKLAENVDKIAQSTTVETLIAWNISEMMTFVVGTHYG